MGTPLDLELKTMLRIPALRRQLMRQLYEVFHIYDVGFPCRDLRDAGLKMRNLLCEIDFEKYQLAEREWREYAAARLAEQERNKEEWPMN